MGLEEAANGIATDVEFAHVALERGLVAKIILNTIEVNTNAGIGLDDIETEDLQVNLEKTVTTAHALTSTEHTCNPSFLNELVEITS